MSMLHYNMVNVQMVIGEGLLPAIYKTNAAIREFAAAFGTKATPRRRPKRVAKKLAKRGGYMRCNSIGALMWDGEVDDG